MVVEAAPNNVARITILESIEAIVASPPITRASFFILTTWI
jgi:hypothetical protein